MCLSVLQRSRHLSPASRCSPMGDGGSEEPILARGWTVSSKTRSAWMYLRSRYSGVPYEAVYRTVAGRRSGPPTYSTIPETPWSFAGRYAPAPDRACRQPGFRGSEFRGPAGPQAAAIAVERLVPALEEVETGSCDEGLLMTISRRVERVSRPSPHLHLDRRRIENRPLAKVGSRRQPRRISLSCSGFGDRWRAPWATGAKNSGFGRSADNLRRRLHW